MGGEILGTGKLIHDFSNGNRQKIGIIGAMLIQPRVLVLDEPFNYLDPSSQIVVARLIREMNRDRGTDGPRLQSQPELHQRHLRPDPAPGKGQPDHGQAPRPRQHGPGTGSLFPRGGEIAWCTIRMSFSEEIP
jgi:ABC-type multidrug transport system, ATPase component